MAVIGEALAVVKAAHYPGPPPKRFRIHPLDVQALERHYEGHSLQDSINRLMGVPLEQDCGVRRGRPEVDYE